MSINTKAIDHLLGEAAASGKVAGVAAAAADLNGPLYEAAFGWRDLAGDAAMTADTVLWIASMTKAVTSVAALQLVAQGKLSLDEPLAALLPGLASPHVLAGFDPAGEPVLRPAATAVTLRQLLTHTSGYAYTMWDLDLTRYIAARGLPDLRSGKLAALDLPLKFDPGTRWEYGIGTDWAGLAVERASGMKLGEYLAHHILIPLGMHDTGFKITHSMRARLARIHMRLPDGGLMPIDMEIRQDPEFESGGGGLYSTVRDYLRFLLMILNSGTLDGATILSPEMIQLALTNQIAPLEVTKLASAMPGVTQDVEFFPGIPKGWGLIGMTNEEAVPGLRSAGSIAWAGLANTYWWIDKAKLQCGVIATQTLPFADPAVAGLAMAFERALG